MQGLIYFITACNILMLVSLKCIISGTRAGPWPELDSNSVQGRKVWDFPLRIHTALPEMRLFLIRHIFFINIFK